MRDVRPEPKPEARFPVPLSKLRAALEQTGVRKGDLVLVHSSTRRLMDGWPLPDDETPTSLIPYSLAVIDLLIDAVGPTGHVLMPTESKQAGHPLGRFFNGSLFDYRTAPSSRGLITELFRRKSDVVRSVAPWYNISVWGPDATELVQEHISAAPFPMGPGSPWFKFHERGGKVALLGTGFGKNSIIRLPEMTMPQLFPHPIHYDKPIALKYIDRDNLQKEAAFLIRIINNENFELERFAGYVLKKHGIYSGVKLGSTEIWVYSSQQQYDMLIAEMKNGVYPAMARQWGDEFLEMTKLPETI
ncbi:MAG: AAC(3) family N-acetyltransferase [Alphaproteobacteria bacterium]|nr:AAC(3) family N-acetyltransferase [Alphaproteobacteria bacterium]